MTPALTATLSGWTDRLVLAGIPFWNPRNVPTGTNTHTEDLYYQYMWHYVQQQNPFQRTSIQWADLIVVFVWVLLIAFLSYLLIHNGYHNQNKRGAATDPNGPLVQDMYPVESYNGVVTERNGGVDFFNYAIWALAVAWFLGIMFFQLVNGQIY